MKDVIVVGTGPAGSTAARILGESGFDVLALEARKHPKRKVCGGGLNPSIVRRLGIESDDLIEVRRSLFVSPSGFSFELESDEPLSYNLPREQTDLWFLRTALDAGVEVREGEFVEAVREGEDSATVFTKRERYEARAVIGADGFGSRVAASLGLRPRGWFRGNAFCPVSYVPSERPRESDAAHELYMGLAGAGYAWIFRHADHLNIGIGALMANYRSLPTRNLANFVESHKVAAARVRSVRRGRGEVVGAYIPYNGILRRLYSKRTLLVGDAGGFVNTLTGEGVRWAVRSAELAAGILRGVLEDGEPSEAGLSRYQSACEEDDMLGVTIALGREIRDLMFRDYGLLDEIMRSAAEDPEMGNLLLDLIYTRDSYRNIVKRMLSIMPKGRLLKVLRVAPGPAMRLLTGTAKPHFDPGRGRSR